MYYYMLAADVKELIITYVLNNVWIYLSKNTKSSKYVLDI